MTDPYRDVRDEIFSRLVEMERESYRGTLEPFEAHAAKIKLKLHESCDQYIEQLRHGYEVIIKNMK